MRFALAVLVGVLVLLVPVEVGAEAPPDIVVYDYTTTSASYWTPIIKTTVDEFNAKRPSAAPRLVYAAESGSFDCLDLPSRVSKLAGIIICDTHRPGEFPYDPNAPKEGWAGLAHRLDDDTARIVLNSYVPEGYYLTAEDRDNTVCHEMMHAYTGIHDDYDSDANSCVWGNLLSPGTTDVRLMRERWTAPVAEPPRHEPVTNPAPSGSGWVAVLLLVLVPLAFALVKFVAGLFRGVLGWGAVIVTGIFVLNLVSKGAGPMLQDSGAGTAPQRTPTLTIANVTTEPNSGSPNETGDDDHPGVAISQDPPPDEAEVPPAREANRQGCDPAYPDEDTCIPPGPPLDQPCSITNERNFTVLPPDPRRLDADGDGIGCEPISP